MAGSSARRARRLHPDDESTGDKAAADDPGSGGASAARRPLNRTAAKRPTAARPDSKRPTAKQPSEERPAPSPDVPAAPASVSPPTGRAPLMTRIAGAIDKRGDAPAQLSAPLRMQGNEPNFGYVVAAILVVIPVVFLTDATGKGAPAHPSSLAPAIAVVLALVMAASIRLSNRILTAFLGVTSTLAISATQTPNSVRFLSTVDLLFALGFAMWVTLRQSKARNAVLAERRRANQAARGARPAGGAGSRPARGRRGRKAAETAEPAGPPPSARYTPPKKRT